MGCFEASHVFWRRVLSFVVSTPPRQFWDIPVASEALRQLKQVIFVCGKHCASERYLPVLLNMNSMSMQSTIVGS